MTWKDKTWATNRATQSELLSKRAEVAGDPAFHAVLDEMRATHDRKQQDYGTPEDPFANYRSSEDIGIPAWKNAFLRTTEKVNRVKSFIRNGRLANEGVEDAFMDIAVTAIISLVTYRQEIELERRSKAADAKMEEALERSEKPIPSIG